MKHLGDITKIKGCNAPVVDCVIGGSPCQDLSVAGKRAGLAGERSGLYMEQIRIIKEMRHKDEQCGRTGQSIRPRYMVWENVPGAFSSNKGKDFAAVLEEAIRVAEPEAPDVPVPEKGWPTSGCIVGDSWSVAWRVLDAQFWGVPQRRRRIALIADFGGQSAHEILFVRKGLSGDLDESQQTRKATSRNAENRSGADDRDGTVISVDQGGGKSGANFHHNLSPTLTCTHGGEPAVAYGIQGSMIGRADHNGPQVDGVNEDVSFTLNTTDRHAVVYGISPYHSNCMLSDNPHSGYYEADTARTLDALQCGYPGCNQGGMAVVEAVPTKAYSIENHPADSRVDIDESGKVQTLTSRMGTGGGNVPMVMEPAYCIGNGQVNDACRPDKELSKTLNCMDDTMKIMQPLSYVAGVDSRNATEYEEQTGALQSSAAHNLNSNNVVRVRYIVRRLTPLECERLQGFPDGWTDIGEWIDSKGKKHKEADSPRYKALGNSIAIPPWKWVLKRLCACYERDATMASLFDGIGGFPYIWEQINGKGSCLWASEIEEFPMAVTKLRFGGNNNA